MVKRGRKPKFAVPERSQPDLAPHEVRMLLHPVQKMFVDSRTIYKGYVGGIGCVAPETIIAGIPAGDRKYPGGVNTLFGPAVASAAFPMWRADIYRVKTQAGREVAVTLDHQFLTPTGWRPLRHLGVGVAIAADETVRGAIARDTIESISFLRHGEFYDLHVPYANHYAANGLWHHNCGKSYVGAYDLLVHAEPGCLCAVVSPTYRMLSDSTQRSFIEVAQKLGLWDEAKYRKTDNQTILNNSVEVLFRSGDEPGKLRGPSLRRAWLDEASQMKEEVYGVMIGRLRFGGEQGTLTGTFTPSGKEHWTYRVFGDTDNKNVALFHCSTKDNPFISPEFYENLVLQYGKGEGGLLRAQQELEGQFVCVEGAEWPAEWFTGDLWFDEWPTDSEAIRVTTLDSSRGIGGKTGDYSAFANVMYSRGTLYVEADMDNVRNSAAMAETAVRIQKTFQPHYFGLEEEFGGSVLADDITMRANTAGVLIPLVLIPTGGANKEVRIRRLTPYLARRMVCFRRTPNTKLGVAQMESFPHAEHDDFPDALEMAVRLINESGELG